MSLATVILMAEPGVNLNHSTISGMPFSVGPSWEDSVPANCMFAVTFCAPPHSVALSIRLGLCRKLLMPGRARWRSIDTVLEHGSLKNGKQTGARGLLQQCITGEIIETEKKEDGQLMKVLELTNPEFDLQEVRDPHGSLAHFYACC